MKRVKDKDGVVHFYGSSRLAICGKSYGEFVADLFGFESPTDCKPTHDQVTCPDCARIYCQIKNAPWNEVEDKTMDSAVYAAEGVKHDATSISE